MERGSSTHRTAWPNVTSPLPAARIRSQPGDFVVEEIAAYEPSGEGDHLFVTFRKIGLTTDQAVERIARLLGASRMDCGVAGLKDRHAVTTQTVSFLCPDPARAEDALAEGQLPDVEIVAAARHPHKLRTGHLRGNRFTITLRGLEPGAVASIEQRLRLAFRLGVPNSFGEQRFGRQGDNAERAVRWLSGASRPPRSRGEQRLLFSALQSKVFNAVLDARIADGSWTEVLAGDLAKRLDTGGLFLVPAEGPELDDARRRAEHGEICATGPMFGPKMRCPEGRPAELEASEMARILGEDRQWSPPRRLGEGTRRPLVMRAQEGEWHSDSEGGTLTLSFVLPKGGYATTLLASICSPVDAHGERPPREDALGGTNG